MMRIAFVMSLLCAAPVSAQELASVALDDPSLEPLSLPPVGAATFAPSPGPERAALLMSGAMLGIPAALAIGMLGTLLTIPTCDGCGYGPMIAGMVTAPLAALITIPAGVFLFGNLSGRGADFGWTLLGGVLGALPGAAMIVTGVLADETNSLDPGIFYGGGAILSGIGVITGAIVAFEASSRPGDVTVEPGLGRLTVRGRFD